MILRDGPAIKGQARLRRRAARALDGRPVPQKPAAIETTAHPAPPANAPC